MLELRLLKQAMRAATIELLEEDRLTERSRPEEADDPAGWAMRAVRAADTATRGSLLCVQVRAVRLVG